MNIRSFQAVNSLFGRRSRSRSLYDKLGGERAIDSAVDILYNKISKDGHVNGFFDGICMHYQRYKLKVFLTMALGGPVKYTGKDLRSAHAKLVENGLDDSHFDHVVAHLGETLEELKVPAEEIEAVISITESTRDDILGRDPG